MILWFFDSWLGWQMVMKEFQEVFPDIEMIIEMDRIHAPYGDRSPEEIREFTYIWVEKLFFRGADVVVLACNTASVHALRWLQQESMVWRHILWVTIPWAEAIVEWKYKKIGVIATEATVKSRMYKERVHILDDAVMVEEVGAPGLVPLIEGGIISGHEIDMLLWEYLSQFSPDIEALVLGCTHYPMILSSIEKMWIQTHCGVIPDIVDPGREAAKKMLTWMLSHQ